MRIVCITLGLFIVSFSAAAGDDFVNFSPRTQPFFSPKGLWLGGSYVNRNDDSNSYLKSNNSSKVVESYVGKRARQVIIAKGRYVRVTYRKDNGESETVEGFVQAMDATELTIYRGVWRQTIPKNRISALMILNHLSQRRKADIKTRPTVARKIGTGLLTGGLCAIAGGFTGMAIGDISAHNCEGDLCGFDVLVYMGLGMAIGYIIGVPIGVSKIDPHDQFRDAMLGSLLGAGAGIAITSANNQFAMSLVIFPLIGATIMSEQSRDTYENRRFSVGLAPAPDGNVRAIATLRF